MTKTQEEVVWSDCRQRNKGSEKTSQFYKFLGKKSTRDKKKKEYAERLLQEDSQQTHEEWLKQVFKCWQAALDCSEISCTMERQATPHLKKIPGLVGTLLAKSISHTQSFTWSAFSHDCEKQKVSKHWSHSGVLPKSTLCSLTYFDIFLIKIFYDIKQQLLERYIRTNKDWHEHLF